MTGTFLHTAVAQGLRPEKHRGAAPIALDDTVVPILGEEPLEIWWRGRQWAVTAYGIEALDGRYPIDARRLVEKQGHSWPEHMADKDWVDVDEFATSWMVALVLHGQAGKLDPTAVRQILSTLPPRAATPA